MATTIAMLKASSSSSSGIDELNEDIATLLRESPSPEIARMSMAIADMLTAPSSGIDEFNMAIATLLRESSSREIGRIKLAIADMLTASSFYSGIGKINMDDVAMLLVSSSSSSLGTIGVTATGEHNFEDPCRICFEPFNSLNPPHITSCMHEYHYQCIMKWSQIKRQCPVCSERLVSLSFNPFGPNPFGSGEKQMASSAMEKMQVEALSNGKTIMMPKVLHFCGTNRRERFEIIQQRIGTSNNGMVRVFRAKCISSSILEEDTTKPTVSFVAVKCVSKKYQPQIVQTLRRDVCRNNLMPDHRNIIGITKEFDYKSYYCVVFPLMENSLRSIMQTRFSKGLPEECIVFVLKETLTAMSFIHMNKDVLQVNAGNIFFTGNEIKLAFSASTYECKDQQELSSSSSSQSYLPMRSISRWGVAPEYPCDSYAYKSNIWMVGITALELAYGGLWVSSSGNLQYKLQMIESNKKLPGHWKKENGIKMLKSFLFKERHFSKAFQKMVIKCVSYRPGNRPGIEQLLADEAFTKCKMDMNKFSRIIGG